MGTSSLLSGAFPLKDPSLFPTGYGKRPVIFDILGPDLETSILPVGVRMVLHVNPSQMSFKMTKKIERIQTRGGWVEQHWGDDTQGVDFEAVTGGFVRLYQGLTSSTSPSLTGATRRETLAYDSYLDLLALFHNNGSVYDETGMVAMQGVIKVTLDEGSWLGWFTTFQVSEAAEKPYQFSLTASMEITREIQVWRTV